MYIEYIEFSVWHCISTKDANIALQRSKIYFLVIQGNASIAEHFKRLIQRPALVYFGFDIWVSFGKCNNSQFTAMQELNLCLHRCCLGLLGTRTTSGLLFGSPLECLFTSSGDHRLSSSSCDRPTSAAWQSSVAHWLCSSCSSSIVCSSLNS